MACCLANLGLTLKKLLVFLLMLAAVAAAILHMRYSGGEPDLATQPRLDESRLEEVLRYPDPIGNVAVSRDGRLFLPSTPNRGCAGTSCLSG